MRAGLLRGWQCVMRPSSRSWLEMSALPLPVTPPSSPSQATRASSGAWLAATATDVPLAVDVLAESLEPDCSLLSANSLSRALHACPQHTRLVLDCSTALRRQLLRRQNAPTAGHLVRLGLVPLLVEAMRRIDEYDDLTSHVTATIAVLPRTTCIGAPTDGEHERTAAPTHTSTHAAWGQRSSTAEPNALVPSSDSLRRSLMTRTRWTNSSAAARLRERSHACVPSNHRRTPYSMGPSSSPTASNFARRWAHRAAG